MKKATGNLISFGGVDPAVESLITAGQQRAGRTAGQRRKASRDAGRNRITLDVSPELENDLTRLAESLSVPVSSLAAHLLRFALGSVDVETLRAGRVPTRSMRWEFVLPEKMNKSKEGDTKRHP